MKEFFGARQNCAVWLILVLMLCGVWATSLNSGIWSHTLFVVLILNIVLVYRYCGEDLATLVKGFDFSFPAFRERVLCMLEIPLGVILTMSVGAWGIVPPLLHELQALLG